jgi:DNA gyrase subunit A
MLEDLGSDTVEWRANYDATLEEPIVLPSRIPQLLMNGSTGIAVGMATNIPPHNLREIIAALVALIDDPKLAVKDLVKHIKGPDFPTGGEILNAKKEIREIYETGQGAIRLRGEYKVETQARGKKVIVVTSIPYTVNKSTMVEEIANEIIARKLPLIVDVRDESTTDVRVVLELKTDASPEAAMAYLYKHTGLQRTSTKTSRVSADDESRRRLAFARHAPRPLPTLPRPPHGGVTQRLEHEKKKLLERLHPPALPDLRRPRRRDPHHPEVESRADAAEAHEALRLGPNPGDAVLEIRLYQLARLEIEKIRAEMAEKRKRLQGRGAAREAKSAEIDPPTSCGSTKNSATSVARASSLPARSSSTIPRPTSCTRTRRSCSRATAG